MDKGRLERALDTVYIWSFLIFCALVVLLVASVFAPVTIPITPLGNFFTHFSLLGLLPQLALLFLSAPQAALLGLSRLDHVYVPILSAYMGACFLFGTLEAVLVVVQLVRLVGNVADWASLNLVDLFSLGGVAVAVLCMYAGLWIVGAFQTALLIEYVKRTRGRAGGGGRTTSSRVGSGSDVDDSEQVQLDTLGAVGTMGAMGTRPPPTRLRRF